MKSRRSAKTSLVPVSSILQNSQKKTQHAFQTSRIRKIWPVIVGTILASQTKPKKIERNILWISVDNSALNYELLLMKPALMEKIHSLSDFKFKDVKFIHEPVDHSQDSEVLPVNQKFLRPVADENESLDSILKRVKNLSMDLQKKRKD